jgi:TatD DNase family protein
MQFIDTHCHLDGEEFRDDLDAVVTRAREAGVAAIGVPGINLDSCQTVLELCRRYPGYCYPMLGLHPEDVKADWKEVLERIKKSLTSHFLDKPSGKAERSPLTSNTIAIGEVGLDYYWSREFEKEQLEAFEEQVRWAVELQLPLMIHCRKAQNEMVAIIKKYQHDLTGGVFHCFTGNEHEAEELLQFDKFVLGVGGVSTFKKSHLPEVLPAVVPLERIVLETDAPYMAPVPRRGERNEPAFVALVLKRLAEAYGVSEEEVAQKTNENVARVLGIII